MSGDSVRELLAAVLEAAVGYHSSLSGRKVRAEADVDRVIAALDVEGGVPRTGARAEDVFRELVTVAEPGLTAMSGPRFFGWVIGGTTPASLAADWMCSVWDQNAGTAAGAPAATAFEMVALKWLVELLGLPPAAHGALVTGGTMANFVALAAARNHVLSQVGWDVEQQGLFGAPPITILAGHERHDTVDKAVRMLGIGKGAMTFVGTDGQGRIQPEALRRSLGKCGAGPVILCTQAGNVNSGSFDPFATIHAVIEERKFQANPPQVWWHVDGAFGAWAKACPSLAGLMAGAEHADSWSTDAHKMLNVPYDSGVVFTRHPVAHRRAMAIQAPYLSSGEESPRFAPGAFAPELSRRARGFAVWAAIRELGSLGIAELVLRLHQHAVLLASLLDQVPGARVLNEVVFNQVVVEFFPKGDEAPSQTRLLCVAIQAEGTCYPTPTLWRGSAAIRFSVTNATTTAQDIHKTAAAVARVRQQFT